MLGAAYLCLTGSSNVNTATDTVSALFMSTHTLVTKVHLAFYTLSGLGSLALKLRMNVLLVLESLAVKVNCASLVSLRV